MPTYTNVPFGESPDASQEGASDRPFDFNTDTKKIDTLNDKKLAALQRTVMSSLIGKHITPSSILQNVFKILA